jgi:hypothetical protein
MACQVSFPELAEQMSAIGEAQMSATMRHLRLAGLLEFIWQQGHGRGSRRLRNAGTRDACSGMKVHPQLLKVFAATSRLSKSPGSLLGC